MTNMNLVVVDGIVTREARPAHTTLPWQWTFSMDAGDLLLPILFGKQDDTVGFLQETAASVTQGVRVRVRGRLEMKSDRVLAVRADHVETERRTALPEPLRLEDEPNDRTAHQPVGPQNSDTLP